MFKMNILSRICAFLICGLSIISMRASRAESPSEAYADRFETPGVESSLAGDSALSLIGGCMWGGLRDVAVSGNYAYAVMHHGLGVFDISDPVNPDLAAFLYINFLWSWNIDVVGDYAYIVDYHGLKVVDISDPEGPNLLAILDTPGDAYDITVDGNYAYVAERDGGLQIIDVSYPASPALAGNHATASSARSIAIKDTLAFVADYLGGLRVFDISDPYAPTPLGHIDSIGRAVDLVVRNGIVFVACDNDGLRVVDVSDPAHPALITTYAGTVEAENIAGSDNYIYISDYNSGMEVVNVTYPTAPALLGDLDVLGRVCEIGSYLYLINAADGLRIIEIGVPENPVLAGSYETIPFGYDMKIIGNYAYGVWSELNIVDISDPSAPSRIGSVPGVNSQYLAVIDTLALSIGRDSTLKIFAISDPENPYLLQTLDSVGYAYEVVTDGAYAYVPTWQDGLVVIDVSDPSSPAIVANHYDFNFRAPMLLTDHLLYISGLHILNVSDPMNPYEEGWYWGGGTSPGDLTVVDTLVYIASGDSELMIGWLEIGSVADPTTPYHIGGLSMSNELADVAVLGNYAFTVDFAGLQVYDISDPTLPVYLTGFPGPGFYRVETHQNHIYVVDQYGLLIFALATPCGDVTNDGQINIGDAVYLIDYIFKGGNEPQPQRCVGETNGDGDINVGDAIFIINFIFRGGPAPVDTCCR